MFGHVIPRFLERIFLSRDLRRQTSTWIHLPYLSVFYNNYKNTNNNKTQILRYIPAKQDGKKRTRKSNAQKRVVGPYDRYPRKKKEASRLNLKKIYFWGGGGAISMEYPPTPFYLSSPSRK